METDVVAAIFDGNKVLILQYNDKPGFEKSIRGKWGLPGGRVEDGEDPAYSVIREVMEETGLDARNPRKCYETSVRFAIDNKERHVVVYRIDATGTVMLSEEHVGYKWEDTGRIRDVDFLSPNFITYIEIAYNSA